VALLLPLLPYRKKNEETIERLRQLGVAVHNFESTFLKMPPAYWPGASTLAFDVGYGARPGAGLAGPHTVHVYLLPYVEQHLLSHSLGVDGKHIIPQSLAPADPSPYGKGANVQNLLANLLVFSDGTRKDALRRLDTVA